MSRLTGSSWLDALEAADPAYNGKRSQHPVCSGCGSYLIKGTCMKYGCEQDEGES